MYLFTCKHAHYFTCTQTHSRLHIHAPTNTHMLTHTNALTHTCSHSHSYTYPYNYKCEMQLSKSARCCSKRRALVEIRRELGGGGLLLRYT